MKYQKYTRDEIVKISHESFSLKEFSNKIGFNIRQRNIKEFNDFFHIDIENIISTNNKIKKLKDELIFLEHDEVCDKCGRIYRNGDRIRDNKTGHHFCSDLCSKQYSSDFAHTDIIKQTISEKLKNKKHIVKCQYCNKNIEVNINKKIVICNECIDKIQKNNVDDLFLKNYLRLKSNHQQRRCRMCGAYYGKCKNPDICSHFKILPRLIKYLHLNVDSIGSEEIYDEFNRIKSYLYDLYWNKNKSIREIKELCGYEYGDGNFSKLLSYFIKFRTVNEGVKNAIKMGVMELPINKLSYRYNQGFHTTWENKKVFYRSSYELDYCNDLDKNKISYDMESLRISYIDTQRNIERVAIPDFLLINENKIVEVKSKFTYNKQNMIDKVKAYRKNGYKFCLLFEHKMYNEDEFLSIDENKNNTYSIELENNP